MRAVPAPDGYRSAMSLRLRSLSGAVLLSQSAKPLCGGILRALALGCGLDRSRPPVPGAGPDSVGGAMSVCAQPRCGTQTPPWSGCLQLNHKIHASTRLSAICTPGVTRAWRCCTEMSVDAACGRGTTAKSLFGLMSWRCPRRCHQPARGSVGVDVVDCPSFLSVKEVRVPPFRWSGRRQGHGLLVPVRCGAS